MCGGTYSGQEGRVMINGLSPRVRGNPGNVRGVTEGVGSIPACAGEPSAQDGLGSKPRVYPRVCGGTARH